MKKTILIIIIIMIIINIDYYMAFFRAYPLSALGHDISPRADRLKGMIYERGLIKGMI